MPFYKIYKNGVPVGSGFCTQMNEEKACALFKKAGDRLKLAHKTAYVQKVNGEYFYSSGHDGHVLLVMRIDNK